jgi:hypothetical protein
LLHLNAFPQRVNKEPVVLLAAVQSKRQQRAGHSVSLVDSDLNHNKSYLYHILEVGACLSADKKLLEKVDQLYKVRF